MAFKSITAVIIPGEEELLSAVLNHSFSHVFKFISEFVTLFVALHSETLKGCIPAAIPSSSSVVALNEFRMRFLTAVLMADASGKDLDWKPHMLLSSMSELS